MVEVWGRTDSHSGVMAGTVAGTQINHPDKRAEGKIHFGGIDHLQ